MVRHATTPLKLPLRILATSDLHAHLLAFDYAADCKSDSVGLARTASLIRAARTEQANTLLFDCGDLLQGTVVGEMARLAPAKADGGTIHPMIAAMNVLGYDGATLGNHDFDFGFDFACRAYGDAAFPVVVSNFAPADPRDRGPILPLALLDRRFRDTSGQEVALRIGLIGLIPPQTAEWDRDAIGNRAVLSDMVVTAKTAAVALRAQGADLVVALAHTGLPRPDGSDRAENAALDLASIREIDVLLLGHTHRVFPVSGVEEGDGIDALRGTINGKPAVKPGLFGSHLGVVDLLLSGRPAAWHTEGYRVAVRPIAERTPARDIVALTGDDATLSSLSAPFHAAARAHAALPVGRTRHPLHSYFALVKDCAAMTLIAEAQEWWAERRLADTVLAGLPVVSAVSPLKAGGRAGPLQYSDVPVGAMSLRHIDDLYPFANTFAAVAVTGAELRDIIDRAANVFARIEPGPVDQVLFDEDTPSYVFDILHGLTYAIDVTRPPRDPRADPDGVSRVVDLCWNGRPVADGDRFALLANSHRLSGPAFQARIGADAVQRSRDLCRDILRAYIGQGPEIAPVARPTWRFAGAGGTTVVFSTGPGATLHLNEPDAPAVKPGGHSPTGFVRYRMVI